MFSSSAPLLTCCPLHLASSQPVYVSLVNVSGIMMTPVMELLMISMMTFMIMFLPKSRQLSAIGKEGIYLEDQEDGYSINSGQRGKIKKTRVYRTTTCFFLNHVFVE